ncbi:MAG: restriction endonuclease subunit S [Thermodesulfobacteriota bacterium]
MELDEICELIVDCEHKTAPTQTEGYPSIRTPNIGRGYFLLDGVNHVSEETYRLWTRRAEPRHGDLIMAREAPVGNVAMVPQGLRVCLGQRTLLIRPMKSKVNPRYLVYLLIGDDVQSRIHALTNGVTVPHLNMKDVRELVLPDLPPLPVQHKIASILSAYDDLIENNLRRIKILEEMAQNLYREWFVKFRFPGHEKVRFKDSPLGMIPEGWEVKTMPDVVIVRPSLPVPKNDQIPFVSMGCLSENSMLIGEIEYRGKASGARFQNGDTLLARITPCLENGKTGFVQFLPDEEAIACGSTEFIVLRSKALCQEYVYLMARSDLFRDNAIKSMSGATGRQRVREECFKQFLLAQPPVRIINHFHQIIGPLFESIYSLDQRNKNLRRTRDLLLPKLISGELDVSELDIVVPEEAEAR